MQLFFTSTENTMPFEKRSRWGGAEEKDGKKNEAEKRAQCKFESRGKALEMYVINAIDFFALCFRFLVVATRKKKQLT